MKKNTAYQQWIISQYKGNNVKESINIIVEQLLSKAKQHTLPIKISSVAKIIGIDPRPLYFNQPYDGGLINVNGGLRIALNLEFKRDNRLIQRHRFTYAHELMHCLAYDFNNIPNERIAPLPTGMEEEYLCNYGAAKLILPKRILHEYLIEKSVFSSNFYSEIIKDITQKADCSIPTVVIELLDSDALKNENKLYILSAINRGHQDRGKLKPRCVIGVYFDENGKRHKFLGPNNGLEHIRIDDNDGISWSLLNFHDGYKREFIKVENEKLIRTTDGWQFSITGAHIRLNENFYVWSELSIKNLS